MKTVRFAFEKETPGTFRFTEVDAQGVNVQKDDIVIGTLYVRKTAFAGHAAPTFGSRMLVTLTVEGA